jgi:hypothetical protein
LSLAAERHRGRKRAGVPMSQPVAANTLKVL